MKMIGEILKFKKRDRDNKYLCMNKKAGYLVGVIVYYTPWESWIFEPGKTHSFSTDMLGDIKDFMEQLK